jgi:hypothetical protein
VVNDGSIAGENNGDGIYLGAGGSVTNVAAASITAGEGVWIFGTGTVVNDGSIAGGEAGIVLVSGGSVTNAASASIAGGGYGVRLFAGGTLTNAGMIVGNTGTAVYFGGTGSNLLALDPGGGFSGLVTGSPSAGNTLELASAASAGTVTGLGTQFVNFGPIEFDAGADWSIGGNTAGLAGTISGFAAGDTIELTGVTETGSSYVGGVLTLDEASGSATLDLPGSFTTASFNVTANSGGTEVTLATPCFCAGTRLLTASGEVAVEALAAGDVVVTLSGRRRPLRWIGHRRIELARHPQPQDVCPVRIAAHAMAPGVPHRDLLVSPDHALFLTGEGAAPGDGEGAAPGDGEGAAPGVLIPARHLCNGATIRQEAVAEVVYYHVELDSHDILLAEGLPAESYLDTGNRGAFANGGGAGDGEGAAPAVMHPDFALRVWETKACARLVVADAELIAVRSALLRQAKSLGHATTTDAAMRLVVDGRVVPPKITAGSYRFHLPAGARSIRLVSRRTVPAHMRPDSVDHRCLGVAVSRVALDGRQVPLNDPRLGSGWHSVEAGEGAAPGDGEGAAPGDGEGAAPGDGEGAAPGWRWTDGDACLAIAGVRVLEIELAITARYWRSAASAEVASLFRAAFANR